MKIFTKQLKQAPLFIGLCATALFINGFSVAHAASFALDFQADTTHDTGWAGITDGQISCNFGGVADKNCGQGAVFDTTNNDLDNTPFMLEKITAPDGKQYFHMIMGDPNADMAQEYYINATGNGFTQRSASNGDGCYNQAICQPAFQKAQQTAGNGWDPLALDPATTNANTGNGSGNPNKVIMRQVTGLGTWDPLTQTRTCTGDLCQEFLKATLANKPVISQEMSSNHGGETTVAKFKIDMSNSDYLTDTAAAAITNTLDFSASTTGSFNQATDAQNSNVNGGQYTYTPGNAAGTPGDIGSGDNNGSGGTFSKGFDPSTFDYGAFRDPAQNAAGAGNMWK